MKVVLHSILAETNLDAPPKSLFSDIHSRVCNSLGLNESWYFGLCYKSIKSKELVWLDTSKKVLKKLPTATKNLNFRIKYYPEDVENELIENITVQMFYMEVKKAILEGDIFCPADTAALLASYSLQVEFGDWNENRYNRYLMTNKKFLPHRLFKLYNVDPSIWVESIASMWKKLSGTQPEDGMIEYLKIAQNLDMFGVTYFNILNKKKTKLLLGVSAFGLNIYTRGDKLTPLLTFPWSEMKKLKFKGRKFIIKFSDKKVSSFIFQTRGLGTSKQIHNLAHGNKMLHIRRRNPDSPEVKVLREKANALKALRQEKNEKIKLGIAGKEDSLRREENYQQHLQKLQNDLEFTMRKIQQEIAEKLEETRRLQKQIEDAKKDEEEYKIKQHKATEAKLRERAKMEQEDRRRHDENENGIVIFCGSYTQLPEFVQVSLELQSHTKSLQEKLQDSMREEEETVLDRIHRENIKEERDKYKTLTEIREENCAKRIKIFDKM